MSFEEQKQSLQNSPQSIDPIFAPPQDQQPHSYTPPPLEQPPPQPVHTKHKRGFLGSLINFFIDTFQVLIIVGGISLIIRFYVVQPFIVLGPSMEPYLQNNQLLMVDEITYRFRSPARGDIIVLKPPHDSRDFIKRLVGLPGEHIQITSEGKVLINGNVMQEPYLSSANQLTKGTLDITLGNDEYFVMGDNRSVSNDSRGGVDPRTNEALNPWTIHRKDIKGRAFLRWWPLDKFTLIEHHAY
jgi:signal peptidase I